MSILFFVFCFLNIYGPFTTNLGFVFNVLLFICIWGRPSNRIITRGVYFWVPCLLVLMSVFSVLLTRDPKTDFSIIGTYVRMLVTCLTFPTIIVFFLKRRVNVLHILSIVLFIHCITILVQMVIPSLENFNSVLFRFERDDYDLTDYALRRLGLTGGYDLSALYAALSVIIALEEFFLASRRSSLFIFIISFVATLFTSRTGMAVSVLSVLLCVFINRKKLRGRLGFASLSIIAIVAVAAALFALPVILQSFNISFGNSIEGADDYGANTYYYLFNGHLEPILYLNIRELLWGYGCGVRKTDMLLFGSDIGYIKQIYQVGIIGVILIITFCVSCVKKTNKRFVKDKNNPTIRLGCQLMWILFFIYLFFNYKNHFMYAVCSFEIFIIIYWVVFYHAEIRSKTTGS